MSTLANVVHWLAALIVLAEALNELERTAPCVHGLPLRARLVEWLKAIAWGLLALGAGGAIITPLMQLDPPTLPDMCILLGSAVLIVRTRIKEG